jgi:hypothetical protein
MLLDQLMNNPLDSPMELKTHEGSGLDDGFWLKRLA